MQLPESMIKLNEPADFQAFFLREWCRYMTRLIVTPISTKRRQYEQSTRNLIMAHVGVPGLSQTSRFG